MPIDISKFDMFDLNEAYNSMSEHLTNIHVWLHQVQSGSITPEQFTVRVSRAIENDEMKSFIAGCNGKVIDI